MTLQLLLLQLILNYIEGQYYNTNKDDTTGETNKE